VVEAVNKGFARARGQVGAIQSSDDFYLPDAIAPAVEALKQEPRAGFVYGDIAKVDSTGTELSRTILGEFSIEAMLSFEIWIPQPSTFFMLDLAKSLGGWREDIPYAPDTNLWLAMAFRSGAKKLDAVVAKRRMHEAQRDTQGTRVIASYRRMIDTCQEIKRAPSRVRRAAAAGKLLNANRYGYRDPYLVKLLRQWLAVLLYPRLMRNIPLNALIPGWYPLRGLIAQAVRSRGGHRP